MSRPGGNYCISAANTINMWCKSMTCSIFVLTLRFVVWNISFVGKLFGGSSKSHEPIPIKYSVRTAYTVGLHEYSQPPEATIWHFHMERRKHPLPWIMLWSQKDKSKRTDASQLCNLRPFHGRHRYCVTLLFAHKTNVKLEAERTHKLLKCRFTVSVHVKFSKIMILYSIPVHVILLDLFHR